MGKIGNQLPGHIVTGWAKASSQEEDVRISDHLFQNDAERSIIGYDGDSIDFVSEVGEFSGDEIRMLVGDDSPGNLRTYDTEGDCGMPVGHTSVPFSSV